MARVKIELPSSYLFETELSVRICDLNYGGHLGNDALLSLVQEARVRFIQNWGGKDEGDFLGASLIMTTAEVVYKSEGHQGDRLRFSMAVGETTRSRFDLLCVVKNLTTDRDLAHVRTGFAFFDYVNRRPLPIPPAFWERWQEVSKPLK